MRVPTRQGGVMPDNIDALWVILGMITLLKWLWEMLEP